MVKLKKNKKVEKKTKDTLNNKIRKKFKKLHRKLPSIFYFTINSKFVFDPSDNEIYRKFSSNLNSIKPKLNDINFLDNKIEELAFEISSEQNDKYLSLSKTTYESIIKFKAVKNEKSEIEKFIIKQLENNPDRSKLTCRNLAALYSKESGKVIHKSQMNNIMRKKIGLHYIKTSLKTSKINSKKNLLFSFCFIRIVIRAIKLGFKILYQDESSILNSNNNYRCWRFEDEKIFINSGKKKRKNLILLIGEDSIIHYKFNDESTNEQSFLSFMKESINKIKEAGIEKYLIIMDNLSVHKTGTLLNFYKDNNINILFNSPYCSYFNNIELAFRSLKSVIYKKVFANIEEVEKEIEFIMNQPKFKETLKANYRETLCEYQKFIDLNNKMSFNDIII